MKREFYEHLHERVETSPGLKKAVVAGTKALPGIVYVAYPLLVVFLLIFRREMLLRGILVPAAGFLICTVLRAGINAPRPYEVLGIPAITKKDTVGKSFPSRHAACGAVIAVTALWALPPLGWFLLAVSLLIPLSRVLAGVHFLRDVITGWCLGALMGWIGIML